MPTKLKAVLGFFVFFIAGFFVISRTITPNEIQRDPAAVNEPLQLTGLSGSALVDSIAASLSRDLIAMSIEGNGPNEQSLKILQMRQIKITANGKDSLICAHYPRIFFEFEGIHQESGDSKPRMIVEDECVSQTDSNKIRPLRIPTGRILSEKIAEGIYEYQDIQSAKVTFYGVDQVWPKTWKLKQVRFFKPENGDQITIFAEKIRTNPLDPFILEF